MSGDAARGADEVVARVRSLCLALPGTAERASHGEAAWFVDGRRMYAVMADHHHDDRLALWCAAPDGVQHDLAAAAPARYFRPPYVGHRGWLGVYLDVGVDWDAVALHLGEAHRVVAAARPTRPARPRAG